MNQTWIGRELTAGRGRAVVVRAVRRSSPSLGVALFATGIGPRPAGAGWDRLYDVVLYNCAYLPAAAAALDRVRAGPRRAAGLALADRRPAAVRAGQRPAHAGRRDGGNGPYPPAIDLLALVAYLLLYVAMVGLIRARVPRFHPSMWLDGVIGALGTTALGVAFLIGPYLHPAAGRRRRAHQPGHAGDGRAPARPAGRGGLDPRACAWTARCCSVILALLLVLAGDVVLFARIGRGHLRGRRPDGARSGWSASASPRSPPTAPRPPAAPQDRDERSRVGLPAARPAR